MMSLSKRFPKNLLVKYLLRTVIPVFKNITYAGEIESDETVESRLTPAVMLLRIEYLEYTLFLHLLLALLT